MANKKGVLALAGAAVGLGVGIAAERSMLKRRRLNDPQAGERFGTRRGERSQKIILRDGAEAFIEEVGPESSRGVVFIHGSALRTDLWHYQMPGIGGQRLVFYDLRGHGLSERGEAELSILTLTQDLEEIIDACRLDEVVIVGHSVGGMIALEFAIAHLDLLGSKVKGLALLNTTYGPAVETLAGGAAIARFERVTRRPFDLLGTQSEKLERLRRVIRPSDAIFWSVAYAGFGAGASAKQIDFTYDMLSETQADVIFELIKAYRDFDVRDRLSEVNVPVLVIGGTQDRLTQSHASEYIATALPKSDLHVLEGSGHMTMLERHRELNELLEAFTLDVLGPPGAA
ncbi:MAG: alpha/beta fold hydrolase [Actinobacteria bacterium]|nr:alpha/beta fold hydrolase [Actinomycetota bacterium]